MSRPAAFFDLDETLIDANSAWLWARYERTCGNISRLQELRVAMWLMAYKLSMVDIEAAFDEAVRRYTGVPDAELNRRTVEWFRRQIEPLLRDGAKRALTHHRQQGHPLVVLTTSSCYAAAEVVRAYDMDDFLANRFELDAERRLTGRVAQPICYGPGKVEHAERWAQTHDVDLDLSWFYTDSYSDLPMLERVQNPRAVNPDLRLRRAARRRGWPILDW